MTPIEDLYAALERDDAAGVRAAVAAGADFEKTDSSDNDRTPLMVALLQGAWRAACALIDVGARLNGEDDLGWTPLHHAFAATEPAPSALLDRLYENPPRLDPRREVLVHAVLYGGQAGWEWISAKGLSPTENDVLAVWRSDIPPSDALLLTLLDSLPEPEAVARTLLEVPGEGPLRLIKKWWACRTERALESALSKSSPGASRLRF